MRPLKSQTTTILKNGSMKRIRSVLSSLALVVALMPTLAPSVMAQCADADNCSEVECQQKQAALSPGCDDERRCTSETAQEEVNRFLFRNVSCSAKLETFSYCFTKPPTAILNQLKKTQEAFNGCIEASTRCKMEEEEFRELCIKKLIEAEMIKQEKQ